jgi:hypothetical protein
MTTGTSLSVLVQALGSFIAKEARVLEHLKKVEERWDIVFQRFHLRKALGPEYVEQCNEWLADRDWMSSITKRSIDGISESGRMACSILLPESVNRGSTKAQKHKDASPRKNHANKNL